MRARCTSDSSGGWAHSALQTSMAKQYFQSEHTIPVSTRKNCITVVLVSLEFLHKSVQTQPSMCITLFTYTSDFRAVVYATRFHYPEKERRLFN